jgi:hypothetical protein
VDAFTSCDEVPGRKRARIFKKRAIVFTLKEKGISKDDKGLNIVQYRRM